MGRACNVSGVAREGGGGWKGQREGERLATPMRSKGKDGRPGGPRGRKRRLRLCTTSTPSVPLTPSPQRRATPASTRHSANLLPDRAGHPTPASLFLPPSSSSPIPRGTVHPRSNLGRPVSAKKCTASGRHDDRFPTYAYFPVYAFPALCALFKRGDELAVFLPPPPSLPQPPPSRIFANAPPGDGDGDGDGKGDGPTSRRKRIFPPLCPRRAVTFVCAR